MKVWIDFENVPHAQVFRRWIKHLELKGHEVVLTADILKPLLRLCEIFELHHHVIGHIPGKGKFDQLRVILIRSNQLRKWESGKGIDVALNHGSRSHQLAAWSLGIPVMTLDDYEHSFQLFSRLFATDVYFTSIVFENSKLPYPKIRPYDGLKEHLSIDLGSIPSDNPILEKYNIPADRIIVVVREPSSTAHYHDEHSTELFNAVLDKIRNTADTWCIALPRDFKGAARYEEIINCTVILPDDAVDGHALISNADLVVSGGGTIGREAAVIGVPAVSVFRGEKGGVDRYLEEVGRLKMIGSQHDIDEIKIEKSNKTTPLLPGDTNLLATLTAHLEDIAGRKRK